ncbi:hypothetical protein LEP1GSC163_0909 [Leptospira santarosai str. CBC379]|uniref:Uncharacterized protein n=1 Tax=Leptospira santarosai str. MOR084 TaxID=1049984 RepID=A0A0E2BC06_9LEPT|nr:hypothetical protein LEP1GSC179_3030 [Leptospira santarosai str. MOR084]EKR93067.1 hypothetical protein LEP1GSC163_0909 [Leptospira santarosai str. CBC379]
MDAPYGTSGRKISNNYLRLRNRRYVSAILLLFLNMSLVLYS